MLILQVDFLYYGLFSIWFVIAVCDSISVRELVNLTSMEDYFRAAVSNDKWTE